MIDSHPHRPIKLLASLKYGRKRILNCGEFFDVRDEALRAHATQIDPDEPWWFGLSDAQLAEVYPWEDWILAVSAVDTVLPEDDLLAGLRGRMSW